jgi:hypothetical protein
MKSSSNRCGRFGRTSEAIPGDSDSKPPRHAHEERAQQAARANVGAAHRHGSSLNDRQKKRCPCSQNSWVAAHTRCRSLIWSIRWSSSCRSHFKRLMPFRCLPKKKERDGLRPHRHLSGSCAQNGAASMILSLMSWSTIWTMPTFGRRTPAMPATSGRFWLPSWLLESRSSHHRQRPGAALPIVSEFNRWAEERKMPKLILALLTMFITGCGSGGFTDHLAFQNLVVAGARKPAESSSLVVSENLEGTERGQAL